MDYESIINTYTRAYAAARARRDVRADAYGRRLSHWIRVAEANGHLTDTGSAFQMGRTTLNSNTLVLS